ncbi:MAG: O-antigen ligase family protein [Leptospira sp.]|nr:O-antigen ligase family protein [Leptospira sp.]
MILKLLSPVYMLIIGFAICANEKLVIEFSRFLLIFFPVAILLVYTTPLHKRKYDFLNLAILTLVIFGVATTVQSMTHLVEIEIPRQKVYFRILFGGYLFYLAIAVFFRHRIRSILLATVLFFTSFPFSWSYHSGSVKSFLVFLFFLFVLTEFILPRIDFSRIRSFFNSKSNLFIFILSISFLVSNFIGPNILITSEGIMRLLSGVILFYFIRDSRSLGIAKIVLILAALYIFQASIFIYSLGSYVFQKDILNFSFEKKISLAGVNANDISGYLLAIFPVLVSVLFIRHKNKKTFVVPVLLLLFSNIILLVLTQARASWLVEFAMLLIVFYYLFKFRFQNKSGETKVINLILLFFILIFVAISYLVVRQFISHPELFDMKSLYARGALWKIALKAILSHPLTGIGYENYSFLASQKDISLIEPFFSALAAQYRFHGVNVHTHNLFLQLWLDGGFFYLAGFLFLLIYCIRLGLSKKNINAKRFFYVAFSFSILSVVLQGFANYNFFIYPVWFGLWIMMGAISRTENVEEFSSKNKKHLLTERYFFLKPVIIVICFLVIGLHSFAIYQKEESLSSLSGLKFINAQGATIIAGEDIEGKPVLIAEALSSINRALLIYPKNPELNLLAGEANFAIYRSSRNNSYLNLASRNFETCIAERDSYPYCLFRLSEISGNLDRQDEKVKLRKEAEERDPFGLYENGFLKNY